MALPRMRTIKELVEEIKRMDSSTAITEYYVRDLVTNKKIPCVRAGRKILVNLDMFIEYLQNPVKFEKNREIPHTQQGIRRVSD